jgi:hypothetical protein
MKAMCSTKEFRLNLEIAKLKGSELNGSIIPEFICLLRQLNMEWHNTAGAFLRFPGEPEDDSPHIFCPDGVGSNKFDLHAEYEKVYTDLNFSEALRAFFSVAFIGNIHYPEAGESVAIVLQRKLAGINAEGNLFASNFKNVMYRYGGGGKGGWVATNRTEALYRAEAMRSRVALDEYYI